MTKTGAIDTSIRTLGTPKLTSRLPYRTWVDDVRLPIQVDRELCDEFTEPVCLDFEAAGPRKKLYQPGKMRHRDLRWPLPGAQ